MRGADRFLLLRLLAARLGRNRNLTLLRLTGLVLAVSLAAAVPTFVAASTERVLARQLEASGEPLALVVGWRPAGGEGATLAEMGRFLASEWPSSAGLLEVESASLAASVQGSVHVLNPQGKISGVARYLKLAELPEGMELASGRLPEPGQPEVVINEALFNRYSYSLGQTIRMTVQTSLGMKDLDLRITGTIRPPKEGPLFYLSGSLDSTLLTSPEYWRQTGLEPGDVTWALILPGTGLRAAAIPKLVGALADLPYRVDRLLPGTEVLETPLIKLAAFVRQMNDTQRFLLVLLTPVFLLVLFFIMATAQVIVDSRRVEIAVLRSRGSTPLRVIAHYLPEGLLLALVAWLIGLALTPPLVQVMGLSAGFLHLVGRPPLTLHLTSQTWLFGLVAALLAEAASLWPLIQAVPFTVATMRQEAVTRSPVREAIQLMLELILLGLLGYGTWQLTNSPRTTGVMTDPFPLALPALFLVGAGLILVRLMRLLTGLLYRLLAHRLTPALSLALGLLRAQPARYRSLSLMLVLTLGLGIYGAAFARTLDRDLTGRTLYRVGSDLHLQPYWEQQAEEVNADGEVTEISYREPPYSELHGLPGVTATARVQTRRGVSLTGGNRSLGRADLVAIHPQEFGLTARFLPELTPNPAAALGALAAEERAVLLSASLAERGRLAPGDRLRVRDGESETELIVAGAVANWPGRLPEDGDFIITNLHYVQDSLGLYPYAVWARFSPEGSAMTVLEELQERKVRLISATDRQSKVAEGRRQPFRLGIYATLSTGFVVAILVMALTYLLSVGLMLQARAKELGVLRAMGMSAGQVGLSLYLEQLLVMGAAAATGLLAGAWAAALYLPALRQQPGESQLPLRLANIASDRLSLVLAFALTLGLGVAAVRLWMKRLDVQAVLRLGEDG